MPTTQETYRQLPMIETVSLKANVPFDIDPAHPIKEGEHEDMLAIIHAGNHSFTVYDLNKSRSSNEHREIYRPFGAEIPYTSRFLLTDSNFNPRDIMSKGFLEINKEEIIGRDHHNKIFRYDGGFELAAKHFSLNQVDNKLQITDLLSPYGTTVDCIPAQGYEEYTNSIREATESRQDQIRKLGNFAQKIVGAYESKYSELPVADMAQIVSTIQNLRDNTTDRKIFLQFAVKSHPDRLNNLSKEDRLKAESLFKFINDIYDQSSKSFKI